MSILFLLLKIIAVILAVILAFLFLCLFHPVFYQVESVLEENAKLVLKGRFWWLFQILRLELLFSEGKLSLYVRIFGIKKELSGEKDEEEQKEPDSDVPLESGSEKSSPAKSSSAESSPAENRDKDSGDSPEKEPETVQLGKNIQKNKQKHTKTKRKEKKQDTGERKDKSGVFSSIKRELSDEKNKLALSHAWREILYLLSHLKPKYVKGEIHFSTGDPALTGEVTGALSLFPVFYRYKLHVYPDFASDGWYVRGNLSLKGHISLYHFVVILIRLFADKNIRGLIKKIRK